MKLISLNTWGGRAGRDELLGFFRAHKDTDIFCLQELWHRGPGPAERDAQGLFGCETVLNETYSEIADVLDGHVGYFRPQFRDWFGLAIFCKKELPVVSEGAEYVYKEKGFVSTAHYANHSRIIQHASVTTPRVPFSIVNFHGLWNGQGKSDSDDRLLQSEKIVRFIETLPMPRILAGDYNLRPDTESMKRLESSGMRNLITEYGITSTRTSHYAKPEKFADYILVSDGVQVNDFRVLPDEVSDHAALYLDFE